MRSRPAMAGSPTASAPDASRGVRAGSGFLGSGSPSPVSVLIATVSAVTPSMVAGPCFDGIHGVAARGHVLHRRSRLLLLRSANAGLTARSLVEKLKLPLKNAKTAAISTATINTTTTTAPESIRTLHRPDDGITQRNTSPPTSTLIRLRRVLSHA